MTYMIHLTFYSSNYSSFSAIILHNLSTHHSHILNLNAITGYAKGEGGYLIMSDGSTVDVSRGRKELLMQKLQPYKEQ